MHTLTPTPVGKEARPRYSVKGKLDENPSVAAQILALLVMFAVVLALGVFVGTLSPRVSVSIIAILFGFAIWSLVEKGRKRPELSLVGFGLVAACCGAVALTTTLFVHFDLLTYLK